VLLHLLQWGKLQGATGHNAAQVIVNGTQESGAFPGIGNSCHTLGIRRRNGPTQVACRITLGSAGCHGIAKDLAVILVPPVGEIRRKRPPPS
jgi:hypothetical protein